ncbi:MAG: hypothetical protein AAF667_08400 [Pseudomonadota bacterium]
MKRSVGLFFLLAFCVTSACGVNGPPLPPEDAVAPVAAAGVTIVSNPEAI